ncbi:hypothetical protein ASZ90_018580 [hydrocarbon metagenome]|uniref:Uncharacterized protein n=1 Tax=hydrocarbon metagenome TaxID=938273 RepID=A0A0W8E6N6_9ZZZZ
MNNIFLQISWLKHKNRPCLAGYATGSCLAQRPHHGQEIIASTKMPIVL